MVAPPLYLLVQTLGAFSLHKCPGSFSEKEEHYCVPGQRPLGKDMPCLQVCLAATSTVGIRAPDVCVAVCGVVCTRSCDFGALLGEDEGPRLSELKRRPPGLAAATAGLADGSHIARAEQPEMQQEGPSGTQEVLTLPRTQFKEAHKTES